MKNLLHISLIICLALITLCSGDDIVMQMLSKKPINYVSDKFISFSVDPVDLLQIYGANGNIFSRKMMELAPSYLKIVGNNTNNMRLIDDGTDIKSSNIAINEWKKMYDALRSVGIKPIIALPYNPQNWNTRNVMKLFAKLSKLDMNDCIWQLGADFQSKDATNYADDLSTLKSIVDAFTTKNKKMNWSVIGPDVTIASTEQEARLYSELSKYTVEAVAWAQPTEIYTQEIVDDFFSTLNTAPALRTILNSRVPVWLSSQQRADPTSTSHLTKGLNWAQTLGDASKNGFKAVYSPIDKDEWFKPSLSYYITLLHKRLIGQTVFATKFPMNKNRFDTHLYAHCTKNMSRSFTLFGVNTGATPLSVTAKVPFKSGNEFMEYILTVNSATGIVQLNGRDIVEGTVLTATPKFKLPNRPAPMMMPAHSVGFWVFTRANLPECDLTAATFNDVAPSRPKTSSERLLQELILEAVSRDNAIVKNAITRTKRHEIPVEGTNLLSRHRRFISNDILRQSAHNAIDANKAEHNNVNNAVQKRNKRYIAADLLRPRRGNNILNRIYNGIDDMKRRQISNKSNLVSKRSKRQINVLGKLFEKFEFKKPDLKTIFKPPMLKLGPVAIPPIATVHDIFAPASVEKKIFESVENPDLPTGDIHFAIGMETTGGYALDENQKANQGAIVDTFAPAIDGQVPNQFLEMYSNAGLPPPPNVPPASNPNLAVQYGELLELERQAQPAVASQPSTPNVVAQQPPQQQQQIIPPANQHNLEFVVNDLQPTWQKNLENMAKARNNLQQYYFPAQNNPNKPAKISSLLPNVAHVPYPQPQFTNVGEQVFFETRRRRRRAIDARLNDEIEMKVQTNADKYDEYLDKTMEKIGLLDKMLKIVENIERNEGLDSYKTYNKLSEDIKQLGDFFNKNENILTKKPAESANDIQKKCKVLSMTIEQKCLEDEDAQKSVIKRNVKSTKEDKSKKLTKLEKKLYTKTADKKAFRIKRAAAGVFSEAFQSDENHINSILSEVNEEYENSKFIKNPIAKPHRKEVQDEPFHKTVLNKVSNMPEDILKKTPEYVPKFLKVMKSSVDQVMNIVTKHLTSWWHSIS